MSDRQSEINAFLASTGHAHWARHPITGDASDRRYLRLRDGTGSVIMMDSPPDCAPAMTAFAQMAQVLTDAGLCPPQVLAVDAARGLMLLTDLGATDVARWLDRHPDQAMGVYAASIDVLIHLVGVTPPPLQRLTPDQAAAMVAITGPSYAGHPIPALVAAVQVAMSDLAPVADTLALRDFHAENLIWRPDQGGMARVGLLDFQDAIIAPLGYDLASLLRDVRRDVPDDICTAMTARFAAATGAGAGFPAQLACLGAQRNLRILGVFARLARNHCKHRYIALLPRVWAQLQKDLSHPALHGLRSVVNEMLPPPDAALCARLRA